MSPLCDSRVQEGRGNRLGVGNLPAWDAGKTRASLVSPESPNSQERTLQKLAAPPGGISGHKATDSSPVSHFTVSQSPKTRPLPFFPSRESSLTHPLALCVV